MRLYLAGPIKGRPNFREEFKTAQRWLEAYGYEVINPTEVLACTDNKCLEQPNAKLDVPGNEHSRQCYIKHDLIAMLQCDGLAVQVLSEGSAGAVFEMHVAHQVDLPIASLGAWVARASRGEIDGTKHSSHNHGGKS